MKKLVVLSGAGMSAESVPERENAVKIVARADIFVVIGTSLQVYSAAGLIDYAPSHAQKFLIDPGEIIVTSAYPKPHT